MWTRRNSMAFHESWNAMMLEMYRVSLTLALFR